MLKNTSSLARIVSGTSASWVRMGISVVAQIVLVPVYLAAWDAEVYGAWLLLQAVWASINLIDLAHQEYIGNECLRLGPGRAEEIARVVFSGLPIAVCIGVVGVGVACVVGWSGIMADSLGKDPLLLSQWRNALALQAVTWLVTGTWGGLMVRWLAPFGYWPQLAWWGVIQTLIIAVVPALAVVGGADLWQAMIATSVATLVYCLLFLIIWWVRVVRRRKLPLARPEFLLGFEQLGRSLWLVAKSAAEMARQQGSRMILAPLVGVAEMTAFATMRTGANFALQGLATVTAPVLPELMRFLSVRDQARTEGAFATVWLMLCAVLSPTVLIAQWIMPWLFPLWTQGKLSFDPWLFSVLSLGVLVYALAQPAAAILQGNNILRPQLWISVLAGLVAVVGMILLVPRMGVRGAGVALLAAELVSLVATVRRARRWLGENGLAWPARAFATATLSVLVAAGGLMLLASLPSYLRNVSLLVFLGLEVGVVVIYWHRLPAFARERVLGILTGMTTRLVKHRSTDAT